MNSPALVVDVRVLRVPVFYPVHVFPAPAIQCTALIAADDVFHSRGHDDLRARNPGRSNSVHHDFEVAHLLANDLQRINQGSEDDDCRAVLVVMHYRNVELFLESFFNLETTRRRDIFEIDSTECS